MIDFDMRKLNSATKYPSIPTHHTLGPRGILQESGNPFAGYEGEVYATEKINGTNGRIIHFDDDWFIGSREELLTASGDRVPNPALGIVEALQAHTGGWVDTEYEVYVYYFEVYGHRATPAWNTYGDGKLAGVRLFDVARIPLEVMEWPIEKIAAWRDGGGQDFDQVTDLHLASDQVVPYMETLWGPDLPSGIQETRDMLVQLAPLTRAAINQGEAVDRLPEGIVFRTGDRSIITKARFEDYDRTLRGNK